MIVWVIIGVIAVGSLAMRGVFIIFPIMPNSLPVCVHGALDMVPAAAFSALVAPMILTDGGRIVLWTPEALSGVIAIIVGIIFRNLALTMVSGLGAFVLIQMALF